MSVKYLKEMGFRTTEKKVVQKFDINEQVKWERRDWISLISEILDKQNLFPPTSPVYREGENYPNPKTARNAIKEHVDREEFEIQLVRKGIALKFGTTSSLFFEGDVFETIGKLATAIKEGYLDSAIKSHYLAVMRKKNAADKARKEKAKKKEEEQEQER
jgi:hypothetical protein